MQIICVYHSSFLQNLKDRKEQKKLNNLELIAKEINNNSKLKKLSIFVLANMLYCKNALAKSTASVAKIDQAGNTILGICRTIGYWTCIIMCITSIIKELLQGDTKSIAKIITKYALAFSSLYLLPWILDIIKDIFA
ncbi:hypothetical protein [Clostridium haemolyticum]|uniref:Uncharacterized protein n=1 Tax=Clostridium haemolyticum NCTC 9693 TaxID=1443114 RepID=A0ABR4THW0_CLOHA|nr:hypothetical protein [Clostridium haemolyticum]KEI18236.1 hypothetical protein Z960_03675 [Clostridium haemolyticum NCTC 9693]KGN03865.1 hypothetical protein Z961_06060 [Clostridium haemolyticum NCTC 8350]